MVTEKLRHNDEVLEKTLEERKKLIGELLDVEPSDVPDKVKVSIMYLYMYLRTYHIRL